MSNLKIQCIYQKPLSTRLLKYNKTVRGCRVNLVNKTQIYNEEVSKPTFQNKCVQLVLQSHLAVVFSTL